MSAMTSFGSRRSRSPCGARSRSAGIIARARAMTSSDAGILSAEASTLLFQFDRLEVGRKNDLQHLAAVRIVQHLVHDALRLEPAVAGVHHVLAVAGDLRRDLALEHVDHLEIAL